MPEWLFCLRWIHIIGATVLLGTGAGIAFFMLIANRSRDARLIAHVAGTVVLADFLFTATAVVVQPISGVMLAMEMGWALNSRWIIWSIALYIMVGLFWLPVVWIQLQLKKLAALAARVDAPLPPRYHRLYRIWFICGFPAFFGVLAILWLMVTRPV